MFPIMSLSLVETGSDELLLAGNQTPAGPTTPSSSPYATGEPPYQRSNPDIMTSSIDDGQSSPNLVFDFLSNYIGTIIDGQCHTTYALQPLYYHLGCAFFLLAFLTPTHRYGAALYMRCMLIFGSILFAMWSYLVECRPDVLAWSGVFIVANIVHMIILICRLRPVKFEREIEEVYVALFQPLRVSRRRFKKILNCLKAVRKLKSQEIYVQEKITKVDSLSLVVSGKFVVSQNQKALHIVFPQQFLDSPEYFGVSTDDYFQVSITAIDESKVLVWHRDKLKLSIITDEFLQVTFDHILGRDVVKKLMQVSQVSETMAQGNGYISSANANDEDANKPMLLMKKSIDSQGNNGLTALINKQLQANLVENSEHVPLLYVTTPQSPSNTASVAAYMHSSNLAEESDSTIPGCNMLTNGNDLIENSDQHQPPLRPMHTVTLSSGTPANVMRARLNQFRHRNTTSNIFQIGKKNTIVTIDQDNGVIATVSNGNNLINNNHLSSNGNRANEKKKKFQDI